MKERGITALDAGGLITDAVMASIAELDHVTSLSLGKCAQLERLTCMYCRDTGDAATEHIRGLAIKYYYAGLTGASRFSVVWNRWSRSISTSA